MRYFQGLYLEAVHSRNYRFDEIYDTYVDFNDDIKLDINT